MTRRCVICKETNYKNPNSFFSAPKDPQTRQLWQDSIGIDNHTVKDDTIVCSKHFYSTDIITHWFSGVPPNIITIKYKKFRLKPGAYPKIGINPNDSDPLITSGEDSCVFEVNANVSPNFDPSSPTSQSEEIFTIPRKEYSKTITNKVKIIKDGIDTDNLDFLNITGNEDSSEFQEKDVTSNSDPLSPFNQDETFIIPREGCINRINQVRNDHHDCDDSEIKVNRYVLPNSSNSSSLAARQTIETFSIPRENSCGIIDQVKTHKNQMDPNEITSQTAADKNEYENRRDITQALSPSFITKSQIKEKFTIPRQDINETTSFGAKVRGFEIQVVENLDKFKKNLPEYCPEEESKKSAIDSGFIEKENSSVSEANEILNISESKKSRGSEYIRDQILVDNYLTDNESIVLGENWKLECELLNNDEGKSVEDSVLSGETEDSEDQMTEELVQDDNFDETDLTTNLMLFEDLLENHTEIKLPKGWSTYVIPQGHATTIVFSFMKLNADGFPIVEKQVFVKSNMVLQFLVKNRYIDPFLHDLIGKKRGYRLHTLRDLQNLIRDFDARKVCIGNEMVKKGSSEAFWEGMNWRHNNCPLLIDHGISCSKCDSLSLMKRNPIYTDDSQPVYKKQRTDMELIEIIEDLINEQLNSSSCEDHSSPTSSKLANLLSRSVELLEIPKIQKLMIKECLKIPTDGDEESIEYSQTWIFLSLLLYLESPSIYKYIRVNKYMNLPKQSTIRSYLKKIKIDEGFYDRFQQCLDNFQFSNQESKVRSSN